MDPANPPQLSPPAAWEAFIAHAAWSRARPGFDEEERDYKLELANRLVEVTGGGARGRRPRQAGERRPRRLRGCARQPHLQPHRSRRQRTAAGVGRGGSGEPARGDEGVPGPGPVAGGARGEPGRRGRRCAPARGAGAWAGVCARDRVAAQLRCRTGRAADHAQVAAGPARADIGRAAGEGVRAGSVRTPPRLRRAGDGTPARRGGGGARHGRRAEPDFLRRARARILGLRATRLERRPRAQTAPASRLRHLPRRGPRTCASGSPFTS